MRKDAKLQKAHRRQRERVYHERRSSRDYLQPKPPADSEVCVHLLSYDVSFGSIPDTSPANEHFERAVGVPEIEELYARVHNEPAVAIPQLEKWCKEFPDVPRLHNWLASAYSLAGDQAKSQEISHKLYQQHPDYLFAIVSECHAHIAAGDLEWVAQRLDKKWDVKLLYPDRDLFHFTEVRAFHHLLVCYFAAANNIRQAEVSLKLLEQLDPDDAATADARRQIAIARMSSVLFSRLGSLRRGCNVAGGKRKTAAPPDEMEHDLLPGT
jgi:hypothetical protein